MVKKQTIAKTKQNKKKPCLPMQEMQVWFLGQEDPLKKEMAIHSSILAWTIPWTEEPGGLQSVGLQRVGADCRSLVICFCTATHIALSIQ